MHLKKGFRKLEDMLRKFFVLAFVVLVVTLQTKNLAQQKAIVKSPSKELRNARINKKLKILLENRKIISELTLQEKLIQEYRLLEFKRRFERYFIFGTFNDFDLNHRLQILKFQYAFYYDNIENIEFAKLILNEAIKSRKNKLISDSYRILGKAFVKKNISDSAFKYGQLATEFAARSTSKTALALSLRNQAQQFAYFGQNRNAVIKELEFSQISEELNNDFLKSLAYLDIGYILLTSENIDGAYLYFNRSKQLGQNLLSKFEKVKLTFGQILCEIKQGHLKTIDDQLNNLKNEIAAINSVELDGIYSFTLSLLSEKRNNYKDAIFRYEKALQDFELLKEYNWKGRIYMKIANCNIKLKNFSAAEFSISEATKYISEFSPYAAIEKDELLAQIFESTNCIKDALKYHKAFVNNLRKLSISKDAVAISELSESNLREERERFIEAQKQSIEKERKAKEKLEIQRTRNLLISIIVAIVLILGLIILFLRTKQIRSQQDRREAEMSQALLRTQMNPHFVFNAMSVIQSYIFTHSPEKSSQFLVNFSKLMRLILENSPKEFIPLELEEEILEKYLNTQKLRFEDRFEFELDIDSDLIFQKAMVPPMITQPFVENAIEHGQLHTVENGKISISAKQKDNMLEIIVCDNGIGRKSSAKTKKIKTHKSMAINMTRERIEILNRKYRSTGNMSIEDFDHETGRGTKVTILLPLKFE